LAYFQSVDINNRSDQMAITIDDISRETGYHRTTVSRVLSGDKRCFASAKVRAIIQESAKRLNFAPNYFARCLKMGRSTSVGVMVRMDATGVTGAMVKAMVEGLRARNYMPLFYDCAHAQDEEQVLREMRDRMVDGIITETACDLELLKRILPEGLPVVLILSDKVTTLPCVIADRLEAFATGTQWLADRHHRRIAFMGQGNAAAMLNPTNSHRRKIEGYRSAMERLGLFDETLLLDCGSGPGDAWTFVKEHAELFSTITAVLACNDRVSIEVMSGLADIGRRVPEDCSVIGFDDTEFARAVRPQLTTFQPRRAEVGAKAVEMVLDLIEGKAVENATIVPTLIERDSAGPCRRGGRSLAPVKKAPLTRGKKKSTAS
jgi:LacI family transcriptional regulator